MILFFSLIQREKNKHNETNQSVNSYTHISSLQAITLPEISSQEPDFFCIKKLSAKNTFPDCHTAGELTLSKLLSGSNVSHKVTFHSTSPIIGLFSPQKVPEKGNDGDALSVI